MYYNGRRNDHVYPNTCRALSSSRRYLLSNTRTQTHRWPRSRDTIPIVRIRYYFFFSICSVVIVTAYYCSLTNCLTKSMRSFVSFVCRYIFFLLPSKPAFSLNRGFLILILTPSFGHIIITKYILLNTANRYRYVLKTV